LENIDFIKNPTQSVFQDESKDLFEITQTLELKYKEVIDLVYIYGYSQEEASKLLEVPVGTIKSRCRSALKTLRNLYEIPVY
jgi:RNA polymerase sigma factor (sigma-70 family)